MSARSAQRSSLVGGVKRLAIVLLIVPAILAGLLAMHVLTTANVSHASPASASQTDNHAATPAHQSAPTGTLVAHHHEATGCEGTCPPEHDMLGMACILALLMTALLLLVHLTLLRWVSPRNLTNSIMARIAALAPPQPPSLLFLSISRT